jgi:ankyrin repeat protein
MRELRLFLVLFLVSLIYASIAQAQLVRADDLYGGMIVGFAASDASLVVGNSDSGNHLINNKEYRSKVESAFREREQLAHNRKDKLFGVFKSGLSLQQEEALKFLLNLAITNNQKELIEMLIAKGANVNTKDKKGSTPLHLAVKHNQMELAKMLIAKGADVNAKDNWNWTLVHGAAYNGNKDMVELLIAQGANVNGRDGDNRTPLWYAQDKGHSEIVELLKKHGAKE